MNLSCNSNIPEMMITNDSPIIISNEKININDQMDVNDQMMTNITNELEKLSLKDLQKMCMQNGVDIHKYSKKSGNKINKTKKELLNLINSNNH